MAEPEPEPEPEPVPGSVEKQEITENLVYEKPENPLEFILNQVQTMINHRNQPTVEDEME